MWIAWEPTDRPSNATRNGTMPPSGYLELLPLRFPFCQALSVLAHCSRLTPPPAARTGSTPQTRISSDAAIARIPRLTATRLRRRRLTLRPSMSHHGSRFWPNGNLIDRDTPATSENESPGNESPRAQCRVG